MIGRRPLGLGVIGAALLLGLAVVALASASARGVPHPRLTSDYLVSIPCAQSTPAGGTCSRSNAQVPYVPPVLHPTVFSDAAAAENSAPGSTVAVNFFNAACAASPAFHVAVQPFTRASASSDPVAAGAPVAVGTISPAGPQRWARELDFKEPDVRQVYGVHGHHYPERTAYVVVSFSGTLPQCESSLVHGFFGVNLLKQSSTPPPTLAVTATTAPSLRAGMSFNADQGARIRAGFFAPTSSSSAPAKCLSGCDVVTVQVTNKNRGLAGARVELTMGGIQPLEPKFPVWPKYPDGTQPRPFLCQASSNSRQTSPDCDAHTVSHLTDPNGKSQFLFWTPGVLTSYKIHLRVRAFYGKQVKESFPVITVNPYKIAWKEKKEGAAFLLNEDDDLRSVIDKWAVDAGLASAVEQILADRAPNVKDLLTALLKTAGAGELTRAFGPIGLVKTLVSQAEQEEAMTALVLGRFDMTTYGLGSDASRFFSTFARTWASQQSLIADLHAEPGFLTNYGAALDAKGHGPQVLALQVREVSYCVQGQDCGPGGPGIREYLYFGFWAGDQSSLSTSSSTQLPFQFFGSTIVPYDPAEWLTGLGAEALPWLTEPPGSS